jgi:excinuclease ABC subunit C
MKINDRNKLPQTPGVYIYKNNTKEILYIGKAKNLKDRVNSYFQKNVELGPKTQQLVNQISDVEYILVESEIDALLLEANLIKKFQPKYNIDLKDGKSYPMIKITNDVFPRILIVRKKEDDKAKYFGPYPDGSSVKMILKYIRHIFPFCTHKKPYKSCLFIHLGICPGPGISISKIEYKKSIKNIENFLKGKKESVIKTLEKEMNECAKKQQYHNAAKIKKQIENMVTISKPFISPSEYIKNPNLINDQALKRVKAVMDFLNSKTYFKRIECFDVSNISGTDATSSMVVMIDGRIDSSKYRKFKIKFGSKPNDIEMLKETVNRRIKHTEWDMPDLIIVDGGLNQVNCVSEILNENRILIPVIGLAKKLEEVYLPNQNKPLSTETNDNVRFLLQTIRNEAHRFARAYHIQLRRKSMFR